MKKIYILIVGFSILALSGCNTKDNNDIIGEKEESKKEKTKDVKFSYEEIDFFKLQLNETIKGIDTQVATLKWYNLIKKGLFKTLKKQTETVLEEVKNGKAVKKK
mgnify:CR=1 FL=1